MNDLAQLAQIILWTTAYCVVLITAAIIVKHRQGYDLTVHDVFAIGVWLLPVLSFATAFIGTFLVADHLLDRFAAEDFMRLRERVLWRGKEK